MPDERDQTTGPLSKLEVPLSRQYFLYAGKVYSVGAVVFFLIGAPGYKLIIPLFALDELAPTVFWLATWFVAAALFGIAGYDRFRWARRGPDIGLRISPAGVEFVEAGLVLRDGQ